MVQNVDTSTSNINSVLSELLSDYKVIVDKLKELRDDTSRFLLFIAWLNSFLESRSMGRIIVVGGFAVEVYTGSSYRTLDVDIVVENSKAYSIVKSFLEKISEERSSRVYFPLLPVLASKAIDIVGTMYSGRRRPVRVEVDDYHVYVEAPEELLVKYLAAWKYWGSSEDRDKAILLAKTLYDKLDVEYINVRAKEEGVED